nr:hypothetical protein CFP56_62721 [Quercus suber]
MYCLNADGQQYVQGWCFARSCWSGRGTIVLGSASSDGTLAHYLSLTEHVGRELRRQSRGTLHAMPNNLRGLGDLMKTTAVWQHHQGRWRSGIKTQRHMQWHCIVPMMQMINPRWIQFPAARLRKPRNAPPLSSVCRETRDFAAFFALRVSKIAKVLEIWR